MVIYNSNGTPYLKIDVDDDSYRFRELMGKDELVLKFELTEHKEIPVGAYCIYPEQAGGTRYGVFSKEDVVIQHRRNFEYSITLEAPQSNLRRFKLYNPVDGRVQFDYVATATEHLQLITNNLNARYGANTWAGVGIDSKEKLISYNHTNIWDALSAIAEAFETEWEFTVNNNVNTLTLGKVEHNASSPLELSYGANNGFLSGVSRKSSSELPIEKLYVQGGDRNIDNSTYPNKTLLLPRNATFKFDGSHLSVADGGTFYSEYGFNDSVAKQMATDSNGFSVKLSDAGASANEDSLELTEIYPKRVGRVSSVLMWNSKTKTYVNDPSTVTDWSVIEWDFTDANNNEDYSAALIEGNTMTVIFQSGNLAGYEFDVKYRHTAVGTRPAKRFEVVKGDFYGVKLPSNTIKMAVNDEYVVFGCALTQGYINRRSADASHSGCYVFEGAEWDMLREAAKYLFKNCNDKFTFKGELNPIYAKRNWLSISSKLVIGGVVRFTDSSIIGAGEHYDLRIASVKDFINNPHAPTIEMTNEECYAATTLSSTLKELEGNEVHATAQVQDARAYTNRSFRDAKETSSMLEKAFADAWGSSINPVSIQTMQLLAGNEQLQIGCYANQACTTVLSNPIYTSNNKLVASHAYIKHFTLDVPNSGTLTTAKSIANYHRWEMESAEWNFSNLQSDLAYYIYARCENDGIGVIGDGDYIISAEPLPFWDNDEQRWNILMGILNSEQDQSRGYTSLYGYTEILPSQITTEKIRNSDGSSYFDLAGNTFKLGDAMEFNTNASGAGKLLLRGGLIQSGGGQTKEMTVWCGEYSSQTKYGYGDIVTVTSATETISYIYINATATIGKPVTNTNYWIPYAEGKQGETGATGNGISSTSIHYAVSSSGTVVPITGWQPSSQGVPAVNAGMYLWTRTTITYTNGTNSVSYSVCRMGINGSDGAPLVFRGTYNVNPQTGEQETIRYYGYSKRVDVVYYVDGNNVGKYYVALSTTTEGSAGFTDKLPTNTAYWAEFGNSFDSIATGLLLAEEAYLDKAIVRKLYTQSQSGAYILAMENYFKMFDPNNKLRMHVTGDTIVPFVLPTQYSPSTEFDEINCEHAMSNYKSGTLSAVEFTIGNNKAVSLPSASVSAILTIYEGEEEEYGSGDINAHLVLQRNNSGGWETEEELAYSYRDEDGRTNDPYAGGTFTNLPAGTYRIAMQYDISIEKAEVSGNTIGRVECNFNGNIFVSENEQLVRIGSNGFSAALGNDFYMTCALDPTTHKPTILMQGKKNNTVFGIKLSENGLQFIQGAYTYNSQIAYDNTIGGYILRLFPA